MLFVVLFWVGLFLLLSVLGFGVSIFVRPLLNASKDKDNPWLEYDGGDVPQDKPSLITDENKTEGSNLMTDYQQGDIVQLRSGGPQMTVADVDDLLGEPSYECTWFRGEDLRRGTFKAHELVSAG